MKTRIVLIGLFSGLLFGIATPFSKIILEELNSFQLAGLLYLGTALAFLPFIPVFGSCIEAIIPQPSFKYSFIF